MKKYFVLIIVFMISFSSSIFAQEFRKIKTIRSPRRVAKGLKEFKGKKVVPSKNKVKVSAQTVEKVMKKFIASWNTADLKKHLAKNFYQKDRLIDSLNTRLPASARLRLLSVGSYNVLDQGTQESSQGKIIISRVAVLARTQLEYQDTNGQLRRRESEQEYTIKIRQRAK